MAETTGISWTDHTFNPWWGCTKIAPGCDNCYAATLDQRTGGNYWDLKQAPRRTNPSNWNKVQTWNHKAESQGVRRKVFCGSMMDWCDKDAPAGARDDLFALIRNTPWLDWQLLTKRATLIERCLPSDWGEGYPNVWLGVTVENPEFGYPRIEALQRIPAEVKFLSAEPLLARLDGFASRLGGINWVIIGGESGPGHRTMKSEWAEDAVAQCRRVAVPIWFKQWGGNGPEKGGSIINGIEIKEWPRTDYLYANSSSKLPASTAESPDSI
ncbi:MAG: hypothetical protein C9356_15240 [Oleiphilus sp.]|nr:MAG: hypothetical protein C9356_15240 [Oleiphilus sp.]